MNPAKNPVNDPAFLASITNMIAQQLASLNTARQTPYQEQYANQQRQQSQQQYPMELESPISRSSSFVTTSSSQEQYPVELETPISRSNSYMSNSSSSSFSTPSRTPTPTCQRPIKRRRGDSADEREEESQASDCVSACISAFRQQKQDRKNVLHVVLEFFDAAYLAPKQSELFKKCSRKRKIPTGLAGSSLTKI